MTHIEALDFDMSDPRPRCVLFAQGATLHLRRS